MKVHLYFLFIISSLFFVPVLNAGFTENNEDIVNLEGSSLCWGDYDNDGDMDFVIMGRDASGEERTLLYENRGSGNFVLKQNIGEGLYNGSMAWADYDKDGDLDLAISGYSTENSLGLTKLYENDNGFFEDSGLEFQNVYKSDIAWGDYN
ncbi:MAG: FG-GAP repeat domain-containing protein, partial [Elusimicrobiota bacterium]